MSPEKEREQDKERQNDDPKSQKETPPAPKTPMTSAISTDLQNTPEQQEEPPPHVEKDPLTASGLGLVKVDGIDKRYIGMPPALDPFPELPSGLKVTPDNSTFIGLAQVPFSNTIQIKDPATGELYYPDAGVTGWTGVTHNGEPLVPPIVEEEPPPPGNGASENPEQRSFAGNGTVDLVIDEVSDIGAVSAVEIEGAAYPLPAYDVPDTTTLHSTDGATVWESGVNVLVTALYAGGVAGRKKAAAAPKGGEDAKAKKDREDKEKKERDEKEKAKRR